VVAANIAAMVAGTTPAAAFDGAGACYIEVGGKRAMRGEGMFFETPHPVMRHAAPTESLFREKVAWIDGMLEPRR
jgi:sulfide:quinone oxidoreductase